MFIILIGSLSLLMFLIFNQKFESSDISYFNRKFESSDVPYF